MVSKNAGVEALIVIRNSKKKSRLDATLRNGISALKILALL